MPEPELNEMQITANYYVFQKSLRTSWRSCIVLGVLGIILGYVYTQILAPINIILALIGVLLVIAGIRARTTLKPSSLLLSGTALSAAGAWIIIVPLFNLYTLAVSHQLNPETIIPYTLIGSIILGAGFFYDAKKPLSLYRRYSTKTPVKPSDQKLQEMANLIKSILKANEKTDNSISWFLSTKPSDVYRVKLNETAAIIVPTDMNEILFVLPEEYEIVDKGQTHRFQQTHNIEVKVKGATYAEGIMWPPSLQRYEQWKNAVQPPVLTSEKAPVNNEVLVKTKQKKNKSQKETKI